MFRKLKNIDTAYRYVRNLSFAVLVLFGTTSMVAIYLSFRSVGRLQDRVYVLHHGRAIPAEESTRKENLEAEARDHIARFHELFFTLDPDERSIMENMERAMNLADRSAKRTFDNLRERDYYSELVAADANQTIKVDSILLETSLYPYRFRLYGRQQITRPASLTTRFIASRGELREVSRSVNNPHGFLIEGWEITENRDIGTKRRK
ncbi:conjugative transposon protein TraK [Sphingobacterium daejeonense]|uniref:Conjugative transposon protein TraK n=1 Tax=Sphingobacterium daejeonense TaxID=371142 RepID=A0ABW3RLY0_9SPHI